MLSILEKPPLNDSIFEFGSYIVHYVGTDVGANYISKSAKYRGAM